MWHTEMPFVCNYVYTLNSILNTGVIFLHMGFVLNTLEILCVLCSSVYLCVVINVTGLIFKSKTFYIFFRTSCFKVI